MKPGSQDSYVVRHVLSSVRPNPRLRVSNPAYTYSWSGDLPSTFLATRPNDFESPVTHASQLLLPSVI